jgi:hypothetical protein
MYVGASDGCGIDVYDLANPGRPIMRGRASAPDDIRRLWYGAGTLYATLWEAGLAIYETTAVGIHEQPTMATKPREPRIWPSVTDGKVRFTVGVVGRVCGLAVYDASGERIKGACVRASVKGGETQFSIDLTDHAAGVYVVRAESEGKNLTAKVVKVNGR